jgi:hypothetical protein
MLSLLSWCGQLHPLFVILPLYHFDLSSPFNPAGKMLTPAQLHHLFGLSGVASKAKSGIVLSKYFCVISLLYLV